ncbi:CHAT domain-containing protein [Tateyamaria sp. syn59]|uniref:CHAT domain-containing protein n=1 Tax=Tateyamaria sp. syn59 TaxID=2576942 RepID=UPI001676792A|nr:CHAT domain-containing protein [Tateyamaria sp. syn59]
MRWSVIAICAACALVPPTATAQQELSFGGSLRGPSDLSALWIWDTTPYRFSPFIGLSGDAVQLDRATRLLIAGGTQNTVAAETILEQLPPEALPVDLQAERLRLLGLAALFQALDVPRLAQSNPLEIANDRLGPPASRQRDVLLRRAIQRFTDMAALQTNTRITPTNTIRFARMYMELSARTSAERAAALRLVDRALPLAPSLADEATLLEWKGDLLLESARTNPAAGQGAANTYLLAANARAQMGMPDLQARATDLAATATLLYGTDTLEERLSQSRALTKKSAEGFAGAGETDIAAHTHLNRVTALLRFRNLSDLMLEAGMDALLDAYRLSVSDAVTDREAMDVLIRALQLIDQLDARAGEAGPGLRFASIQYVPARQHAWEALIPFGKAHLVSALLERSREPILNGQDPNQIAAYSNNWIRLASILEIEGQYIATGVETPPLLTPNYGALRSFPFIDDQISYLQTGLIGLAASDIAEPIVVRATVDLASNLIARGQGEDLAQAEDWLDGLTRYAPETRGGMTALSVLWLRAQLESKRRDAGALDANLVFLDAFTDLLGQVGDRRDARVLSQGFGTQVSVAIARLARSGEVDAALNFTTATRAVDRVLASGTPAQNVPRLWKMSNLGPADIDMFAPTDAQNAIAQRTARPERPNVGPGELLVVPIIGTVLDPGGLILVRNDRTTFVEAPGLTREAIRDLVDPPRTPLASVSWFEAYRQNWLAPLPGRPPFSDPFPTLRDRLGEMIAEPLFAALQDGRPDSISLLPDGVLGALPWWLARDPASGQSIHDIAVPQTRLVSSDTSASQIAAPLNTAAWIDVDGAGAPAFAGLESALLTGLFSTADHPSAQLSRMERQVRSPGTLAAAFDGKSVLHLSSHGSYDWARPNRSGLLLGGDVGTLTVRQLLNMELDRPPALVVLSACETGLGSSTLGTDFVGLPSTFLEMGARDVVGSLWPVDDVATALLLNAFYSRLLEGTAPATALHEAQTWLRDATRDTLISQINTALPLLPRASLPQIAERVAFLRALPVDETPYAEPFYWAGFYVTSSR